MYDIVLKVLFKHRAILMMRSLPIYVIFGWWGTGCNTLKPDYMNGSRVLLESLEKKQKKQKQKQK